MNFERLSARIGLSIPQNNSCRQIPPAHRFLAPGAMKQLQTIAPLQEISGWMAQHFDNMAVAIAPIDAVIRQVSNIGWLTDALVASEATHHVPAIEGEVGSPRLVKAAIHIPKGVGVVDIGASSAAHKPAFVPFVSCQRPLQQLVLASLPALLAVLHHKLRTSIADRS
jgi:hypothetical protein